MTLSDIRSVAVIGAGLMGHGIAIEFALAGYDARLHSRSQDSLRRADTMLVDSLARLRSLGRIDESQSASVKSAIRMTTDLAEGVDGADLVIESIYEDIDAKIDLFRRLDALIPPGALLASNTSSFPPSALAAPLSSPHLFLNMHFLNPPYLVPLVEVVPTRQTSPAAIGAVMDMLRALGKLAILVRREAPGFVASRLQMALLREALWLVDNDVASPEDVDAAISAGLGRRWASAGVLQTLELAGWDLISRVAHDVFPHLSGEWDAASLRALVERGHVGAKAGRGFYEWTPESAEAMRLRIANGLVEIAGWD